MPKPVPYRHMMKERVNHDVTTRCGIKGKFQKVPTTVWEERVTCRDCRLPQHVLDKTKNGGPWREV